MDKLRFLKSIFGLFILSLLSFQTVAQHTYYVDVTGVNSSGNGSAINPYATLTYALGDITHVAGDSIIVNSGIYTDANVSLAYSHISKQVKH